jgi:hypothetical protein
MKNLEITEQTKVIIFSDYINDIENSIRICRNDIPEFMDFSSNANFFESLKFEELSNMNVEWVIFDTEILDNDELHIINFKTNILSLLYRNYPNLKFILLSSGSIFGEDDWGEPTELSKNYYRTYIETRIIKNDESIKNRLWNLRYDLFDEKLLNNDFIENKIYYGSIDRKFSLITIKSLHTIINSIIKNHSEIKEGTYHIIPKDTQTEYEIFHFIAWKKKQKGYIERSSSVYPMNHILRTIKLKELKRLWEFSGYDGIPTFIELLNELVSE